MRWQVNLDSFYYHHNPEGIPTSTLGNVCGQRVVACFHGGILFNWEVRTPAGQGTHLQRNWDAPPVSRPPLALSALPPLAPPSLLPPSSLSSLPPLLWLVPSFFSFSHRTHNAAQIREFSWNQISKIRKEMIDTFEEQCLTVKSDEGNAFHYPSLPTSLLT